MKRPSRWLPVAAIAALLLTGCGVIEPGAVLPAPTAVPGVGSLPLTRAQVTYTLTPPETTPPDAQIAIETVDTVTGVPYHSERHPMERLPDGGWQVQIQRAVGSLVRYRYVMLSPQESVEADPFGATVRYRLAHVPGPLGVEDRVAGWGRESYSGPAGRILGSVRTVGGDPVSEMIVSAAGLTTFTHSEGRFRLDGLPPGLHNIVVHHPDGRYRVAQQGAIIAENQTTPAEFEVQAAEPITLTFQVTVPGNTPDGLPIRIAGSVRSLGAQFAELPGGIDISPARLPELIQVDGSSYLFLVRMYAGTDLRYKYTLGGGLWNAERRQDGSFVTRQLIVPETETTIEDNVISWGADSVREVRFRVTPPDNTPAGDELSLQLNPFTWFEPLPMVRDQDGRWSYTLRGPLDFADSLGYRYCRNAECGRADSAQTIGEGASGHPLVPGGGQTIDDTIPAWAWWEDSTPGGESIPEGLPPRPEWLVGAEIVPRFRPSWPAYDDLSMARVAALNANAVVLTPTWTVLTNRPAPVIEFDPRYSRYQQDLSAAAESAAQQDLTVILRPELRVPTGDLEDWWATAHRDSAWWSVWFEEYRSFLLTQAELAERAGTSRLVITGAQIAPALPDGRLPDGSSSGVPFDAEVRWRGLIDEVRARFSGEVAFELELSDSIRAQPNFLDAFDAVHVYWHHPLSDAPGADEAQLLEGAGQGLDRALEAIVPAELPVYLSVEYLAVEGSPAACPPGPSEGCGSSADFDVGEAVGPQVTVDLDAQTRALRAVLLQAAASERVQGFLTRRFYPLAALQDPSASVYGKPAGDMLSFAYARLLGIE